ncbi:carbohydrate kinase [Aureimonas sp. Leaf454]|uniref:FGGY-family carbohydrate kinase n=1 Tax=Aureimonas sp. Leaf454 TaxID=1736381 RepID=UPI0006FA21DE|nr:FGGY family carbohydrate kinase [Aureimonas sp. Leaf454]KQT52659.1 carbohydrate kinase [Aureimonas sp. Leaf454]
MSAPDRSAPDGRAVAVLDIGKTNVKLFAASPDGLALEHVSAPNRTIAGPPYRHHDLAGLEDWLLEGLRDLGRRHDIAAIVSAAHGSGGVLVGETGPALPMVDYEQDVPSEVQADYVRAVGSYRERGSAVMLGAAHLARQMLWMERHRPDDFAKAKAFLATPQYWAFRLSGVAAGEVTSLAAQSHLWSPADARPTRLVASRGWERLMPPMRRAYETLGRLKPDLAARTGLSRETRILCGIHDSSANFYRYQAAGLSDLTVVSTGTWIVSLTDRTGIDFDVERPGRSCNADVFGRPMPGMLTMGGREFQAVAAGEAGPADPAMLHRIVSGGTFAIPSFGSDDGLFPGTARTGRIAGPLGDEPGARFTLAVLYTALLAAECLEDLPPARTIVLDGGFVQDPMFGRILAALLPGSRVLVNHDPFGTATGAALLAGHEMRTRPAPLDAERPDVAGLPDLSSYRSRWRDLTRQKESAR